MNSLTEYSRLLKYRDEREMYGSFHATDWNVAWVYRVPPDNVVERS